MSSSGTEGTFEPPGSDVGGRSGSLARVREWILVGGDRLVLATGFSIATFVGFLVLGDLGIVAFVNDDSITRLAGGMIAGSFSLVTLVVSINQLILSREFVAAGQAEEQLEAVASFRDDVAEATAVPASPASPAEVVELLVAAIDDRAGALATAVEDRGDPAAARALRYANTVRDDTDRIEGKLGRTASGTFRVLVAMIGYDDAWQLHAARQLRERHDGELPDGALEAIDGLIEVLSLFGVAREHFKTTYLQRELTRFSQLTVAVGVPATLSAVLLGFIYADLSGNTIPAPYLPYVVSALLAVVVAPLGLLAAYIFRTATVARRTASIGPMIPQKAPDEGPFDVRYGEESGVGHGEESDT